MKNKNLPEKKLSLKKLQMAKIHNLHKIHGGHGKQNLDGCANGDDGSLGIDDGIGQPRPKTK